MNKETRQIVGHQHFRATFDKESINLEKRTIDVVFVTEREVMMYNWAIGLFREVLVCDTTSGDLSRLNNGAPLCDTHRKDSVKNGLGVVDKAWFENGIGRATVRFSKRADVESVWQDVQDGIVTGVSVGYDVYQYETTEEVGKLPLYRATKWSANEISLALVQADQDSSVGRSENNSIQHEVEILSKNSKTKTMNRSSEILKLVRAAGLSLDFAQELIDDEAITLDQARVKIDAKKVEANVPVVETAEQMQARFKKEGGNRASEILNSVRAAKLDVTFAQELVDDPTITIAQARQKIIEKMASSGTQQNPTTAANTGVQIAADETDKRRSGIENALLVRANSTAGDKTKLGEYRGANAIDLARMSLEAQGGNVRGLTPREIAQEALGVGQGRSGVSTSDFPIILGNTINRTLRAAYDLAPRTFAPFVRQTNAKDFRDITRAQLGDLATLDEVKEGGEYKLFSLGEGAEKYRVVKYGKIFSITWETLVNDDLDAFSRVPAMFAAAAAQKQSDLVYAILTGNPAMSDTVALFHASHGNLAAAGTAIDIANMGKARAAVRKQKSPGGSFLNLVPKFLVVGPDKETEALQITSANFVAAKNTDMNVWAGLTTPIVEGRLTGNQWYLFCDPSQIDTIETAFLDGEELFTEMRQGFDVDGMQVKARMVFGTKAIDYRGMYKNPGA